ncbi:hypothetical protein KI688_012541 [Linnemannia hyalina]|uniref:Chitin synthase export chaperone n=1 Tax=Linnemannia hyalina TaxID=64524 RepID=A0A9P7XU21_9FUNG|nr:hypothetical protein KI688_012541 [Linnemannia hyalina]
MTTEYIAPTPTPTPSISYSTSSSNSSSSSSSSSSPSIQSAPYQGTGSWFGDFNALCASSCVPLPTCNLLSASDAETSASAQEGTAGRCLNSGGWPVRDLGSVVISVLGLLFVVRQILIKSRRMFAAVGRTEMAHLYTIYSFILLLQVFTVGGVLVNNNRTHRTFLFITGTNTIWMVIVVFLSLDLAWNITGHHHGHSAGLFFLTLVFPVVAVLLYLVLSCIVVCRKLEVYSSLKYVAMALVTFAILEHHHRQ